MWSGFLGLQRKEAQSGPYARSACPVSVANSSYSASRRMCSVSLSVIQRNTCYYKSNVTSNKRRARIQTVQCPYVSPISSNSKMRNVRAVVPTCAKIYSKSNVPEGAIMFSKPTRARSTRRTGATCCTQNPSRKRKQRNACVAIRSHNSRRY